MSIQRKITYTNVVPTVALLLALSGTAGAATHQASVPPTTPDACIELNGGDYNACDVGNSGRGDLPYLPLRVRTPNGCIELNGGDYNACNVGNSGRGDLPYEPVKRNLR